MPVPFYPRLVPVHGKKPGTWGSEKAVQFLFFVMLDDNPLLA
jgi:hypothetical protein